MTGVQTCALPILLPLRAGLRTCLSAGHGCAGAAGELRRTGTRTGFGAFGRWLWTTRRFLVLLRGIESVLPVCEGMPGRVASRGAAARQLSVILERKIKAS